VATWDTNTKIMGTIFIHDMLTRYTTPGLNFGKPELLAASEFRQIMKLKKKTKRKRRLEKEHGINKINCVKIRNYTGRLKR
jgi:hypothetical protein